MRIMWKKISASLLLLITLENGGIFLDRFPAQRIWPSP